MQFVLYIPRRLELVVSFCAISIKIQGKNQNKQEYKCARMNGNKLKKLIIYINSIYISFLFYDWMMMILLLERENNNKKIMNYKKLGKICGLINKVARLMRHEHKVSMLYGIFLIYSRGIYIETLCQVFFAFSFRFYVLNMRS